MSLDAFSIPFANVEQILGDEGVLVKHKNFVPREGQLQLAKACEKSILEHKLLVAEAGTGTGKTFAYLIPAILSRKIVVISTASKALQDQLIKKDLPFIFNLLKEEPNFMALKGFSNYICLQKYYDFLEKYDKSRKTDLGFENLPLEQSQDRNNKGQIGEISLKDEHIKKLKKIVGNYYDSSLLPPGIAELGDIDAKLPKAVLKDFTCDRLSCLGGQCEYHDDCCALHARRSALQSKVLVVNHALFFSDLNIEDRFNPESPEILFPKYQLLIFDEAHEIANNGREHLSSTISNHDVQILEDSIEKGLKEFNIPLKNELRKGVEAVKDCSQKLFQYLLKLGKIDEGKSRNLLFYKYRNYHEDDEYNSPETLEPNDDFLDLNRDLYKALRYLNTYIKNVEDSYPEYFSRLLLKTTELMSTLIGLMKVDDIKSQGYGNSIASISVNKKRYEMRLTPLEIGGLFGKFLNKCSEHAIAVIMTSATLSVDHKFKKFNLDLGIDESKGEFLEIQSHFEYEKNAALFVDGRFPSQDDIDREGAIIKRLRPVIDKTPGGIFILTTSVKATHLIADKLRGQKDLKRKIICQYENLSNTMMVESFKKDGHAILVGSRMCFKFSYY